MTETTADFNRQLRDLRQAVWERLQAAEQVGPGAKAAWLVLTASVPVLDALGNTLWMAELQGKAPDAWFVNAHFNAAQALVSAADTLRKADY